MADKEQLRAEAEADFKTSNDYGLQPLKHDRYCEKCGKETIHFGFNRGSYCGPCGDKNSAEYEAKMLAKKNALDKKVVVSVLGVDIEVARHAIKEAEVSAPAVWTYFINLEQLINQGTGMFMSGDKGTGKTTLAGAILMKASTLNKSIACIKALDLTNDLSVLREAHILVVDEVHKAVRMYGDRANDDDVNRLYRLVDYRNINKLSTIYISNEGGEELKRMFGEAISDRMKDGNAIVNFKGESFRKAFNIDNL